MDSRFFGLLPAAVEEQFRNTHQLGKVLSKPLKGALEGLMIRCDGVQFPVAIEKINIRVQHLAFESRQFVDNDIQ